MAVAESITNIAAAPIESLSKVRLSANWMAAAGHPGEDANLFDTVKAVGDELCREIGVAIPVGKDSMSMRTRWDDACYCFCTCHRCHEAPDAATAPDRGFELPAAA
jgi:phosphoribosylformylglycinamidine synthase